jgi:hypothetical protein
MVGTGVLPGWWIQVLKSNEVLGQFVGIAEHQGDMLTCLILTDDTLQVITQSSMRSALGTDDANLRASTDAWESGNGNGRHIVMSANDITAITVEPSDLSPPNFSLDGPDSSGRL